jgi:hypothetical protein
VKQEHVHWLIERLSSLWGDQREECLYGFWSYDRHLLWPSGVKLLYHSTEDGNELTDGRIAVEIPGTALDQLDAFQTLLFIVSLREHDFHCSRVDIFFDDFERTITPVALYMAVYEESLFDGSPLRDDVCGFHRVKRITEGNRQGRLHDEVCFGRRGKMGTGKYLRVYDKKLESKGLINSVRWELELSDRYARGAFSRIVDSLGDTPDAQDRWCPQWTANVLGGLIGWAVDFRIRVGGEKNLSRLERHPFWQSILDRLGRAVLAGRTALKSVPQAVDWVMRSVAGTLQMIRAALGEEVAIPMLCNLAFAANKLRPAHLRAIADYRRLHPGPIPRGVSPT